MPKMKTKSSAKKRFKTTASGKIKAGQAGKRHGMIKRSNKFIRDARGTMVLAEDKTPPWFSRATILDRILPLLFGDHFLLLGNLLLLFGYLFLENGFFALS